MTVQSKVGSRTISWSIAAALIVILTAVVLVATRSANRSRHHRQQIAAAKYARVNVGMSPAQVRHVFGRRPEERGATKSPGFLEECWTYLQSDVQTYRVCFQHGRVTRKLRLPD
jgi:outer membrane protein assembly factor BamE (lipoprotein component of BamABCDE complex)